MLEEEKQKMELEIIQLRESTRIQFDVIGIQEDSATEDSDVWSSSEEDLVCFL